MRGVRWAQIGMAALVLLTGCKGFWDAPNGGGGGGGGNASGVFYVMNVATSQVAGFSFAAGSTTPSAISSGSATFTSAPVAMAISPDGGFLYVATGGGVFAFSVGSDGTLTLLNNNLPINSNVATSIAVDGSGTWLLEATTGTAVLQAVPVASGALDTTRSSYPFTLPDTILTGIVSSPANSTSPYVFVAMGNGGTEVIPFNAASTSTPFGTGSRIAVKNAAGAATAIAVDPTNRLLYVAETVAITGTQSAGLRVFTIASSTINEVTGSPYPTGGTGPSAILPSLDGNFVYVANKSVSGSTTGNISGYPINVSGGSFSLGTLINTVATGTSTVGLAEDSTQTYLLAINASNSNNSSDLNVFTFDATTLGKLDAGSTAATGTDPVQASAIVAVP